ncbi:hypothetical protein SLEP1_g40133 [Rubroshorea leprosula]|uniref:Uncharacterized protein n=1 Tax=Rubroshorea leprosula TaxID=152421 RepID=A0AAV5L2H4_9ROSI|nr:hypothetical protein SLEP1_g40133 [Rubroshorea leprosula]
MAYDQQHHLRLVADEGFRLIEEHYGPTGRWADNSLQYYQRPAGPKPPKPVTVVQRLVFSSTSGTYANEAPRVPPPKEAGNPRSNLLQSTQGHGGPNSYQVPPTITSGGWYICWVPPVPTRKGDAISSDLAAKTYGGYLIRDY